MTPTTHRLTPEQKRRQSVSRPLFLAGAGYLLFRVLSRPLTPGAAVAGSMFAPALAVIGIRFLLALLTSVGFNEQEVWWTGLSGRRRRFAWTELTDVAVVKKSERANSPEVVRITHGVRGMYDLPVLIGLPGTWRDPGFEAKTAGVLTAWRTATTAAAAAAAGREQDSPR